MKTENYSLDLRCADNPEPLAREAFKKWEDESFEDCEWEDEW